MFAFIKNHKRDIVITFLLAFAVLSIFDVIVSDYEIKKMKQKELLSKNELLLKKVEAKEKIASLVFNQLEKYYKEAELFAQKNADEIRGNLIVFYNGDTEKIAKDLYDLKYGLVKSIDAMVVISNTIRGKTLNNVSLDNADNNDLIVFLAQMIIGDLSINCATDADTRTILEEVKQQFNGKLAEIAMFEITSERKKRTFWHFLKPKDKYKVSVLSIKTPDLKQLRQEFIKNDLDLDFLAGFEFLAVSRINEDSNIDGSFILKPNGRKTENLQLHIVQGFNLIDQINLDVNFKIFLLNAYTELEKIDSLSLTESENFKKEIAQKELSFHLEILFMATVLIFLCIITLRSIERNNH